VLFVVTIIIIVVCYYHHHHHCCLFVFDIVLHSSTLLDPSRVLRKESSLNVHFQTPEGQSKTELNKFYLCNDILIQAKKKGYCCCIVCLLLFDCFKCCFVVFRVLQQIAKGKSAKAHDDDAGKKYSCVKIFTLDGASVDQVGVVVCLLFVCLFVCCDAHCCRLL
jgi:hypothetical protein